MKRRLFLSMLLSSILAAENIDCLDRDKYGNTLLHNRVLDNNITALKKLLNSDAEIDQKNYKGQTPLHLAVKTNNIKIAEMLIKHHATISVFDVYNFSPLYYANHLKYFDVANLLKRNGAKIEVMGRNQKSELDKFITKFNCE